MSNYVFSKNNSILKVKGEISNLSINGDNNKISFKKEILNLVVNGDYNKINANHRKCYLSNVIINGDYNKIKINPDNSDVNDIQNGSNNKIYPRDGVPNYNRNTGNCVRRNIIINHCNDNEVDSDDEEEEEDDDEEKDEEHKDENDDEEEEEEEEEKNEEEIFNKKKIKCITKLKEFQFKDVKKHSKSKDDKCPICLEKYKSSDIIKKLPCKHLYHKSCIYQWLKQSNLCPICKYDLSKKINKVLIDSDDDE